MKAWPPERIVVAVDFGDASGRACGVAAVLRTMTGARVTVVHGEQFDVPPYFTPAQLETLESELRTARVLAESHTREFAASHGLSAETVVITELPAVDGILDAAGAADLLIVGSHGRRGPSRWWMGSVSERLVRSSPVPVLVVPAGDPVASTTDLLARVLVLEDGYDPPHAVAAAQRLTGLHGGRVTVGDMRIEGCDPQDAAVATLVVVSLSPQRREGAMHDVPDLLTRCRAPILFVPGDVEARVTGRPVVETTRS